jgi:hypothetical protein
VPLTPSSQAPPVRSASSKGLNNKIRVFQLRAYGLRYNEYQVLTCMPPPL